MRMPEETLAATKLRWRPVDQLLPHPSSMPTGCGTDFVAIGPGVATGERGGGIGTRLAALVHREIEAAGVVATLLHHALPNPLSTPFWSMQGYRPLWTAWEARPAGKLRYGTTQSSRTVAVSRLDYGMRTMANLLGTRQARRISVVAAAEIVAVAVAGSVSVARNQDRISSIATVLLAVACLGSAVFYMLRELSRRARREDELIEAVGRLSDRSALAGRLQSTSEVLDQVVGELSEAARSTSTATSEQSAAIAETSATIEEMVSTAGSIADAVQTVVDAAKRTGETMREMQEKVGAIAAHAVSLGQRAQEIGEILGLINTFAEQTNMLALNAAIEAARAGEVGRGFAIVAGEVRHLAERSVQSSESIGQIIVSVRDETNATILATELGTQLAGEVGELMKSTVAMLEEPMLATIQQKTAADHIETAIQQIRRAAEQLAVDQAQQSATAQRLEALVKDMRAGTTGATDGAAVSPARSEAGAR
jgi:methyl-accepting chemotaxis protein